MSKYLNLIESKTINNNNNNNENITTINYMLNVSTLTPQLCYDCSFHKSQKKTTTIKTTNFFLHFFFCVFVIDNKMKTKHTTLKTSKLLYL